MSSSIPSSINNSQKQLINELTRLNQSLKTELQKCHKYISSLENDLREMQKNRAIEIKTMQLRAENVRKPDFQKENQIFYLKNDLDKVHNKLREKRHQIKKLESSNFILQKSLNDLLIQKQSWRLSPSTRNDLSLSISNKDIRPNHLETIIQEQKQTIQLYSKELTNKSLVIQKLESVLEDYSNRYKSILTENQSFRRINHDLSQNISQSSKQYRANEQKLVRQLSELRNISSISQRTRLTSIKEMSKRSLYGSVVDQIQVLVSPKDLISQDRHIKQLQKKIQLLQGKQVWPVTKRITVEEHSILKQTELEKQKLQQQIETLVQSRDSDKYKLQKLKNDFIEIKLDHSQLLTQKTKLVQQNVRLERQKSELLAHIQPPKTIQKNKINNDHSKSTSTKKGLNRTFSIGSMVSSGMMTPKNDDQIPVKDSNNSRNYISFVNTAKNNQCEEYKGSLFRHNSYKHSSFRL